MPKKNLDCPILNREQFSAINLLNGAENHLIIKAPISCAVTCVAAGVHFRYPTIAKGGIASADLFLN